MHVSASGPLRLPAQSVTAGAQYTVALRSDGTLWAWGRNDSGQLGNGGDTLRLRDASDAVVDAVSYSASFPWAIGADALGADDEWTGLNSYNFQYRGRSLERVSFAAPANAK